jgi:tRNA pseudouridine65 synthase
MLDILYQDDLLVAVHKPSGLLVHRTMLDRHETRFALQMVRDQTGRHVHTVHRLDKGTSGVLLFAFEREIAVALATAFEQREVGKRYLAVVRGHPAGSGCVDHALVRRDEEAGSERADGPLQEAVTHYRRLDTFELPVCVDRYPSSRYALLELKPETGRRHQIRRHLKHISHPIIGDSTWGKGPHNRMIAQRYDCARMLLACTALHFRHPATGHNLLIEASPAMDFMRAIDGLRAESRLSAVTESRHNDCPISCTPGDS